MDVEDDALYGREKAIAPMNCRRNKTANSAAGFIMTGFVRAIPSHFNVTMADFRHQKDPVDISLTEAQ